MFYSLTIYKIGVSNTNVQVIWEREGSKQSGIQRYDASNQQRLSISLFSINTVEVLIGFYVILSMSFLF